MHTNSLQMSIYIRCNIYHTRYAIKVQNAYQLLLLYFFLNDNASDNGSGELREPDVQ